MNVTAAIKPAIAAAFSAAADTYDAHADVQRAVAGTLAHRVAAQTLPENPRVLEIGCGTGFLSRALHGVIGPAEWLITDLSPAMLEKCRGDFPGKASFRVMDGERPDVTGPFDLICSSLAFQWFGDLESALRRLRMLLTPGGRLMFATLAADSFEEWRAAHKTLGLSSPLRSYPDLVELARMLPGGSVGTERITRLYPNARTFLDHWRGIGAAQTQPLHYMPGTLRRLMRTLEISGQVRATYHVAYGAVSR